MELGELLVVPRGGASLRCHVHHEAHTPVVPREWHRIAAVEVARAELEEGDGRCVGAARMRSPEPRADAPPNSAAVRVVARHLARGSTFSAIFLGPFVFVPPRRAGSNGRRAFAPLFPRTNVFSCLGRAVRAALAEEEAARWQDLDGATPRHCWRPLAPHGLLAPGRGEARVIAHIERKARAALVVVRVTIVA